MTGGLGRRTLRAWTGMPPGPGSDRIRLTGLRVFGYHGVLAHERENGQEFVVDVDVELDLGPAARSDDVLDTLHYGQLASALAAEIAGEPVNLIETLAVRLVDRCLSFAPVTAATVTVHKPNAPIEEAFSDVSVRLRRTRADRTAPRPLFDVRRVVARLRSNNPG